MDIFAKCYEPSLAGELKAKGVYPYFHALQSRQRRLMRQFLRIKKHHCRAGGCRCTVKRLQYIADSIPFHLMLPPGFSHTSRSRGVIGKAAAFLLMSRAPRGENV